MAKTDRKARLSSRAVEYNNRVSLANVAQPVAQLIRNQ